MPTTITVEGDTLERFNELKRELDEIQADVPDHNADSFLKCLMDTYEAAQDGHYGEPNDPLTLSEVAEIAEQLQEQIDYPERQDTDRIINRIDDLESQLPAQIKEELR